MALKAIRFTKGWQGYNGGEVAGFDDETADGLVASGYATVYEPGAPKDTQAKPAGRTIAVPKYKTKASR